LNPKYLYLSIDALSILLPLLFSFHPKAPFYKTWKSLWPALLIAGFIFAMWDEAFIQLGVWGFNPRYLTGIYLGSLPLEEILFFICIPYACLFMYFVLNHLFEKDYLFPHQEIITSLLIVLALIFGLRNLDKWYTATTFLMLGAFLALHLLKWRSRYMSRFYFAYAFILIPFSIVNGILTGTFIDQEVVWYNDQENLGMRLGTIPCDDVFYNMLMLLVCVALYERVKERLEYR